MLGSFWRPSDNYYFNSKNSYWVCERKGSATDLLQMFCQDILILTILAWLPVMWHLDKDKQGALGLSIMNS